MTATAGEEGKAAAAAEERLVLSPSPHSRDPTTVAHIMEDVFLSLVPAAMVGVLVFGERAIAVVLLSIASCLATEAAVLRLRGRRAALGDGTALVTGLLLALCLPASVPWWVPVAGGVFAIGIAKHAFGGTGHNIFNPALAGRAFLVASWPALVSAAFPVDGVAGATPLAALKLQHRATPLMDTFMGNVGGTIGEGAHVALLIGAAYLLWRGVIDWRIPFAYVGTVAALMAVFGQDPLFHVFAGGLLLGAFFMATDYVTSPITSRGRLLFGAGCGLLTALIRQFGGMPEGVMFSILIMNAFTPLIDKALAPRPFGAAPKRKEG